MSSSAMKTANADFYAEVGARLRACRERADISADALGRAIGMTKQNVSLIENGHHGLRLHALVAAAAALDVPVSALIPKEESVALPSPWRARALRAEAALTRIRAAMAKT